MTQLETSRRPPVAAILDLAQLLDEQYAAAAALWQGVAVSRERYLAELARRINERASEDAGRVLRTMPGPDLYLAIGCADRDAGALAAFRDAMVPPLRRALGRLALAPATIDETVQRVLVLLFVGDGGPPQIGKYSGKGTLRSWVR